MKVLTEICENILRISSIYIHTRAYAHTYTCVCVSVCVYMHVCVYLKSKFQGTCGDIYVCVRQYYNRASFYR